MKSVQVKQRQVFSMKCNVSNSKSLRFVYARTSHVIKTFYLENGGHNVHDEIVLQKANQQFTP